MFEIKNVCHKCLGNALIFRSLTLPFFFILFSVFNVFFSWKGPSSTWNEIKAFKMQLSSLRIRLRQWGKKSHGLKENLHKLL